MNSTLLELYKSEKPISVLLIYPVKKGLSPCLKVKVLQYYYVLFFLIRMWFEFDLIVRLKWETLLSAKFVLKGKPFLYPTEVQKEWFFYAT